jgi:PUA-domain protein
MQGIRMGKKSISKSEIKEIMDQFPSLGISKKDKVEKDGTVFYVNGRPSFFEYEGRLVPHLKVLLEKNVLKSVTIDMNAVKFIVNGADVMRPGIMVIDQNIEKDDLIVVMDQKYGKCLAVTISLFSGKDMQALSTGKVLKNIHFVGDDLWKLK